MYILRDSPSHLHTRPAYWQGGLWGISSGLLSSNVKWEQRARPSPGFGTEVCNGYVHLGSA